MAIVRHWHLGGQVHNAVMDWTGHTWRVTVWIGRRRITYWTDRGDLAQQLLVEALG